LRVWCRRDGGEDATTTARSSLQDGECKRCELEERLKSIVGRILRPARHGHTACQTELTDHEVASDRKDASDRRDASDRDDRWMDTDSQAQVMHAIYTHTHTQRVFFM